MEKNEDDDDDEEEEDDDEEEERRGIWWPKCIAGVGLPDLRIHRLATFFSLRIDDYGNEASLVTLTYTLFARSRSRSFVLSYTPALHGRSSYIPNQRHSGFISGASLLKLCGYHDGGAVASGTVEKR
ncbi:hypothetical protein K0M31_014353 [Melipona bicolor]|uniref:Uncharacterized protein n=1 Tax=Melipona bicolor TaxID=60889 RepID=A0AA40KUE9_9HYME|nr:hypothetical protein K0M31_014353 [Melipona bicolor]